jgi:hypothetical protein
METTIQDNQMVFTMTPKEYYKKCKYIEAISKFVAYDGKEVTYNVTADGGIIKANPRSRKITLSSTVSEIIVNQIVRAIA